MGISAWTHTALLALTLAGGAQAASNYAGMEDDSVMLLAGCTSVNCSKEAGWSENSAAPHGQHTPWAGPQAAQAAWHPASPQPAPLSPAPAHTAGHGGARAAALPVPAAPVPEPSVYSMLLIGIGLLLFAARGEAPQKFTE